MIFVLPQTWGLSVKFTVTITALVAAVAFTVGAVIIVLDWGRFHDEFEEKVWLLMRSVVVTAPQAIIRNDSWFLHKSLRRVATRDGAATPDKRIVTAMILDPNGLVLAHLDPQNFPIGLPFRPSNPTEKHLFEQAIGTTRSILLTGGGIGSTGFLEGVTPLYADQKLLGVARIRLSTSELFTKAWRSAFVILGITLGLVALGSLAGMILSRRMVEPLKVMTSGMEALGRGELANISPALVRDNDELGKLAATFNKVAEEMAEKKSLEEQMAVSAKLVALGRITAGVAHEVNNPLAGMLNCIDTMKSHPDDNQLMRRYLPILEKGLDRIKGIVEGLLIELRVEDSQSPQDLSCLEDLKDIITAEINNRDLNIVWENRFSGRLRIQSRQVQQIVLNLLKNSIQALDEGGTVTFRSHEDGDNVVLEVLDDGPGIPPEHRDQLFDPFFTTRPEGTGLGLWIVYRLVQSMEGVIGVESEVGKGTAFRISLPALQEED